VPQGLLAADISAHLNSVYPQVLIDAIGRKSALLGLFPRTFQVGGSAIEWRVNYAGNTSAGSYGDGDSPTVAGKQAYLKASLAWRYNRVQIRVSRQAMEQAAGNVSLIGDIYQNEIDLGTADLIDTMETQVMSDGTGNGSKDITGIQIAVSASGTYAGILRSTYTWWQSAITNISPPLTEAMIKALGRTLRNTPRKANSTLFLCGPAVWGLIGDLLESDRFYSFAQSTPSYLTGLMYEGGYRALGFEGRPIVEIPGYTANRLDYLDLNQAGIKFIRNFTVDDAVLDGDDWVFQVTVGCNLFFKESHRQGALTNVSS